MIDWLIDRLLNRQIAIKLLWRLLCDLCNPSILIWWFRLWIIPNTLDPLSKAFVIQYLVSYIRYIFLMPRILHQIHIFFNFRLGFSQPSPHASNCIRTKLLRHISVKSIYHWPARFWLLSSSYYPGYPMKKLTFITRREDQLCPTGLSTLLLTVVFQGGKPHTLVSGWSADRWDNLSCVRISE